MTHLYIEQNTGLTEEVNSSIISKLYELASSGDLDNTSDLKGRLHSASGFQSQISYLNNKYEDLTITADKQYVEFEDPTVQYFLASYIGDGTGVSTTDMQRRLSTFGMEYYNPNTNQTITYYNELRTIVTFNEFQNINCDYIGYYVFRDGATLQSIRLPNTVTTLLDYTFQNCPALQSINLDNITTIGRQCFERCTQLDNITLNSNLTSISYGCFSQCTSLTSIDLSNIVSIANNGFWGCTNLESVTSIQNATSIGSNAFYKCNKIQEFETLNLPNLNVLGIGGDGVFSRCTQIKHVVDLGTITRIGAIWEGAFFGCTELLDVTLPETITYIDYQGFRGCTKLKYIKVLSTQVPTYSLKNGFGTTFSYGSFFGEAYSNNDPAQTYNGLTFPIYVRDDLLSQYQAADGWKYVGPNRLRPLSQFATDFPNG